MGRDSSIRSRLYSALYESSRLWRWIFRGGSKAKHLYKWFFRGVWLYHSSMKMIIFFQRRFVTLAASKGPFVEAAGFGAASRRNKCILAPPRSPRLLLSQTVSPTLSQTLVPPYLAARATTTGSSAFNLLDFLSLHFLLKLYFSSMQD